MSDGITHAGGTWYGGPRGCPVCSKQGCTEHGLRDPDALTPEEHAAQERIMGQQGRFQPPHPYAVHVCDEDDPGPCKACANLEAMRRHEGRFQDSSGLGEMFDAIEPP
jgi:hypothetical protein